jgi:uncharacterized membrane protein
MDPTLEKNLGYPEQVTDIHKYLKKFSIYYIASSIAVAVLAVFINLPSLTSFLVYMSCIYAALAEFVKSEKRVPATHEQKKLINGFFLISILFSIVVVIIIVVLSGGQMDEEMRAAYVAPVFWVMMTIILGLLYGATMLFVKIIPSRLLKALEKRGEI